MIVNVWELILQQEIESQEMVRIMVLLGHSSLNMVKRYAALSPEYTRKAVTALSRKKEAAIMNEENRRFLEEHQEQFIQ